MRRMLMVLVAVLLFTPPAAQAHRKSDDVRFATFNASLNRPAAGDLVNHLSHPEVDDVFRRQARNVAEVIQRARPDVLLINEFDFDPAAGDLFRANFLEVSQNGAAPITYPYAFIAPSNTGGVGWATRKWTVSCPTRIGTSQWLLEESRRMSTSSGE